MTSQFCFIYLLCSNAMDDGKITALVLLDLSAAFDTVDHKILLSRLQYHLGIHGHSPGRIGVSPYLLNRPQHVCIGNAISKPVVLDYSVPPRLCARPTVVYCLIIIIIMDTYIAPVSAKFDAHGASYIIPRTISTPCGVCSPCCQMCSATSLHNYHLCPHRCPFILLGEEKQL